MEQLNQFCLLRKGIFAYAREYPKLVRGIAAHPARECPEFLKLHNYSFFFQNKLENSILNNETSFAW